MKITIMTADTAFDLQVTCEHIHSYLVVNYLYYTMGTRYIHLHDKLNLEVTTFYFTCITVLIRNVL